MFSTFYIVIEDIPTIGPQNSDAMCKFYTCHHQHIPLVRKETLVGSKMQPECQNAATFLAIDALVFCGTPLFVEHTIFENLRPKRDRLTKNADDTLTTTGMLPEKTKSRDIQDGNTVHIMAINGMTKQYSFTQDEWIKLKHA
ncbi:hypothetical protein RB195_007246 [Necator americanus]|uniref:Uncharacterized protein n=1 Tax=Necator americanus TaxID=51031 RepID=A0ABR1BWA5_NECAM